MCGIAGFTHPDRNGSDYLATMVGYLRRRGPDQTGFHIDEWLALGHARLIVVDPADGRQPCINPHTGAALVFNGEIYGYRRLASQIALCGKLAPSESDTAVLFAMLQDRGLDATLSQIDGMYAFAFRERRDGPIHLVRDRFGEKPLYYALRNGELFFASEPRALLAHPELTDQPFDVGAVSSYLTLDYFPAPNTLWQGIRKLGPGEVATFHKHCISIRRFWRPRFGHGSMLREPNCNRVETLDELLRQSVRDRLVADVPVGILLSGGVDSSLIAAYAAEIQSDIRTFTIKMSEATFDESIHAEFAARHLGTQHQTIELSGEQLLEAIGSIEELIDEPLADPSVVPTYLVSKIARRKVTVALGGDGADELFGGYVPLKLARWTPCLEHVHPSVRRVAMRFTELLPDKGGYMSLGFVLRRFFSGIGRPSELQIFDWMAGLGREEKTLAMRSQSWRNQGDQFLSEAVPRIIEESNARTPLEQMLTVLTRLYLADDILAKTDRASMYNSLELRAPFLANKVAEFALTLPDQCKVRGSQTKYLLKKLAHRYLPARLVTRRKHGFAFPVSTMIRTTLRERISDSLMDRSNPASDWFNRPVLERLLSEHVHGRRDRRKELWSLYMLFTACGKARAYPAGTN